MKYFIQDEAIATDLRNAGFACELDTSPKVSFNLNSHREWPPKEILQGDWYEADCPLEHGKPFLLDGKSVELLGVLIRRSDQPAT